MLWGFLMKFYGAWVLFLIFYITIIYVNTTYKFKGDKMLNQIKTGEYIAEKRKEKNLTQQELADKLNISNKTVSKWETGVSHS